MLTKERRLFTEAERGTVHTLLSETYQRRSFLSRAAGVFFGLAGGGLLGCFLVFLAITVWNWLAGLLHKPPLSYDAGVLLFRTGVGVGTAFTAWLMYSGYHEEAARLAEERGRLHQDLEGDEAEVWHCEASRVVQMGNEEDGPYFFVEVEPGQALFLQLDHWGEVVRDVAETDSGPHVPTQPEDPTVWPPPPRIAGGHDFPCRSFHLVYAPHTRARLNLVCLDRPMGEWPTYVPSPESTWEMKCYPEDGDVLQISLDTLDADLERWAAQQEPPKD